MATSIPFQDVMSVINIRLYAPQADGGISILNDFWGIDWRISMKDALLSPKDLKHLPLREFDSPFEYEGNPVR